jgi:hypothetical protein
MNRIVALIHQTGLPATLERLGLADAESGQPTLLASAVIPCRIRDGGPAGPMEPTQQSRRRALIAAEDLAAAGFPGPPIMGDRLAVFGRRFLVLAVEPQLRGPDAIAFSLILQG